MGFVETKNMAASHFLLSQTQRL